MKVQTLNPPHFDGGVRGPDLVRWIHDRERVLPGTDKGRAALPGGITGAQHTDGWVIFRGLQVVQVVPEEVHSYWFSELLPDGTTRTGAYEVTDSAWKASFSQRHLADQRHFILVFYDELVEVSLYSVQASFASPSIRSFRIMPLEMTTPNHALHSNGSVTSLFQCASTQLAVAGR